MNQDLSDIASVIGITQLASEFLGRVKYGEGVYG